MIKILFADDDLKYSMLLKSFLQQHGYDVTYAGNGKKAWEQFPEVKPDLVLLDINMPEMDGYEVAEIQAVTVTGHRPMYKMRNDALVTRVRNTPLAKEPTLDVGNFPFCDVAQVAVASIAHITVSFFIFFLVFVFICKGTAFRAQNRK